jgi:hypothetical protein
MKLPRPMVILFGAGATRAAFEKSDPPPPLDTDFFEIALQIGSRGTGKLAKKVAKNVYELYDRVIGIGLEQYYRDIETRLELGTFAKSANRPMNWNARREDLEELIRRVVIQTTCEMNEGPARVKTSSLHKVVLKRIEKADALLTFNYDTVIEESMPKMISLWTPREGYGIDVTGVKNTWANKWFSSHNVEPEKKAGVKLFKLHGSINWRLDINNKVVLKKRPYVVKARRSNPNYESAAFLPPGWHKRINNQPYSAIWRNARLEMERCKTLVIIGYSLPDTDLIARALFLEAARRRGATGKFKKELHVVDVIESTRRRIIELFLPALGPEGKVFQYSSAQELENGWK